MKRKQIFCGIVTVVAALMPWISNAEVRPASIFTDHMVLQRDMPVSVWGTAGPGEKVIVEFSGQKKMAVTDSSNHWKITLDSMPASSKPRKMKISCSNNPTIQFADVLVGEVWICSGQSNMQFGYGGVPEIKALVPSAKNIRTFNVPRTVAFEEQESCEGAWVEQHPESAVAFSFAYFLEEAADVPVGIILTCWGSSSIEAWMPRDMTETVPHFRTMMEEFDADAKTRDRIASILEGPKPWPKGDDVFLRRQSNILYNAMMHPLAPYACRGLVWYQGERNTQSMSGMLKTPWFSRNSGMLIYGDVLKEWMQRYREEWENDDMHFLVVMLPGYAKGLEGGPEDPSAKSWAWMRESQLKALELSGVGVANTIDLGDVKNVHPKDKLPVGKRLALLAARDTLGQKIEAQGPVMKTVKRKGSTLVVHFDHADGLQTTDGEAPSAFWVADGSKVWKPADATLFGQTVVLKCSELKKPLYVRYAFAGKPSVNLINASHLPAYPFRTDQFEP